ncbi:hypothetical protein I7I53_02798 [Histoplasma capsulatum var. duboisii H88]|uniref:Uncharacterized protein n=1 Tax=Ajellomyces capsulatus (strain H88) TaxID=544711 RepID=A0A8A1LM70_AJEC8|nr:hypothetical protein I7I53_02798 [Histoplasma capsulatum var. duboisii H88]
MEKITPCFGSQFHTALHKPLYYFVLTFQTLNLPLCFSRSHILLSPFLSPTLPQHKQHNQPSDVSFMNVLLFLPLTIVPGCIMSLRNIA